MRATPTQNHEEQEAAVVPTSTAGAGKARVTGSSQACHNYVAQSRGSAELHARTCSLGSQQLTAWPVEYDNNSAKQRRHTPASASEQGSQQTGQEAFPAHGLLVAPLGNNISAIVHIADTGGRSQLLSCLVRTASAGGVEDTRAALAVRTERTGWCKSV